MKRDLMLASESNHISGEGCHCRRSRNGYVIVNSQQNSVQTGAGKIYIDIAKDFLTISIQRRRESQAGEGYKSRRCTLYITVHKERESI